MQCNGITVPPKPIEHYRLAFCGGDADRTCCDALKQAGKTADDAVRTDADVYNKAAASAANAESLRNKLGPQLNNLKGQSCAKGIDEAIDTLNSLDPQNSTRLEERMKMARIAIKLDAMAAQSCGVPVSGTSPTRQPKCPDGRSPDPGAEAAADQIKDSLKQAIDDAEKDLTGSETIQRIRDLKKALGFWDQIKNASCIPPNVLSLVQAVLSGRSDVCTNMCHETAKWYSSMSGNPSWTVFFEACAAGCL
ncbi:MAG: hypothetical protein L0Y67_03925 [Gammaproteobacteria bacterium]|nr:hypothetical protein [Gammaproteobacteria bacterium]MCI0590743.1 hypothetical protein [Gammaproteobacteria bacterium]